MTIGEKLRQAREAKGLNLIEIQEQTKLSMQNLEAIERDDYQVLGSDYNTKSVIRAYATVVGLDATALIMQYQTGEETEPTGTEEPPLTRTSQHNKKRPNKWLKIIPFIILLVIFIVIIGSVAYAFVKEHDRYQSENDIPKSGYKVEDKQNEEAKNEDNKVSEVLTPVSSAKQSSSSREPEMEINTTSNNGIATVKATNIKGTAELELTGTTGRCWVSVTSGGRVAYQGVVEMGVTQKIQLSNQVDQVSVRLGNAKDLAMKLNDKNIDFDPSGQYKQMTVNMSLEYLEQ